MCRIHGLRFLRRDAEERSIEDLEVLLQEVRMSVATAHQYGQQYTYSNSLSLPLLDAT